MKKYLLVFMLLIAAGVAITAVRVPLQRFLQPQNVTAAADGGFFFNSGRTLGSDGYDVALGDLDGDSDLDVFIAHDGPDTVWINQGGAQGGPVGTFQDSGQTLGDSLSNAVALADLDGDSDLDAFVIDNNGFNVVWINQGGAQGGNAATFQHSGQTMGDSLSLNVGLGDLDGQNGPDAFVVRLVGRANKVWFNDGNATFSDSGQGLGNGSSSGVALGDVDGDGDLDAFVANDGNNIVWLNQGGDQGGTPGDFADSGQGLGNAFTQSVALGDVDGDGDLDAYAGNVNSNSALWLNQGGGQNGSEGTFANSGQSLGPGPVRELKLADLDDDNDLDLFAARQGANEVWINQGGVQNGTAGVFQDSGQQMENLFTTAVALGDVDGDNDPDAVVANLGDNQIWLNGDPGLPNAYFDVDRQVNDNGDEIYYWSNSGSAMLPIMLGLPAPQALNVHVRIQSASGTMTETVPFDSGQQLQFLNLVNPQPDPSETVTLSLLVALPGMPPETVTDRLVLVFVDGQQGMRECILCYIEWLARLVGFNPTFGTLYHVEVEEQESSPQWDFYTGMLDHYSPELSDIVATHPSLLRSSYETLNAWTPGIEALANGNGSEFMITQTMIDDTAEMLDGLEAEASPGLRAFIQREQDALELSSFAGLNMEEAWSEVEARRPVSEAYVTIILR